MTSGVCQGDPIAGFLFVLAMEPLAQFLRENKQIIPANLSDNHTKTVGLHVDDVWIAVKDDASAEVAIHGLNLFESASGMQTNHTKSYTLNQISKNLSISTTSNTKVLKCVKLLADR